MSEASAKDHRQKSDSRGKIRYSGCLCMQRHGVFVRVRHWVRNRLAIEDGFVLPKERHKQPSHVFTAEKAHRRRALLAVPNFR